MTRLSATPSNTRNELTRLSATPSNTMNMVTMLITTPSNTSRVDDDGHTQTPVACIENTYDRVIDYFCVRSSASIFAP